MSGDTGHYVQLIIALCFGFVLFIFAYLMPSRPLVWALLLLIPFQPINSIYGSINTVLVYMLGVAFLLRGRFRYRPMFGILMFILLAYLLSFSQILPGTFRDHGFYMVAIGANFILFYLVYNHIRIGNDWRDVWNIFGALNVLVVIYCALELTIGLGEMRLFGLEELTLKSDRAAQGRLSGPFSATAMTAEYLGIQILICIYALMQRGSGRYKMFWLCLLAANLGFMIATGNRGGIVSLVVALLVLLFLFRKELGVLKILGWITSGTLLFTIAAIIVVQYTQYNVLLERFEGTSFEGLVPDTRRGWFDIWDKAIEKPIIGHGPRFMMMEVEGRRIPGHIPMPYPHNGYLYLFYTLGIIGLLVYLWFVLALVRQYIKGFSCNVEDPMLRGMPRLGLAILVLVAVSQLRMEMFRFWLSDYQQYLFMIMGAFLAFTHLAMSRNSNGLESTYEGAARVPGERDILQKKRTPHSD